MKLITDKVVALLQLTPSENDIRKAMAEGHVEQLINYLRKGANINVKDEKGATLLEWAVHYQSTEIVSMIAARRGEFKPLLLDEMATLYIKAARNGQSSILKDLLSLGASTVKSTVIKDIIFDVIELEEDPKQVIKTVETLLSTGIYQLEMRSSYSKLSLRQSVIKSKNLGLLRSVEKYFQEHNPMKQTLLIKEAFTTAVIKKGKEEVQSYLHDSTIDLNEKGPNGQSLIQSIMVGITERTRVSYWDKTQENLVFLLQKGVDIHQKDNEGNTLLHHLVNMPQLAKSLLEKKLLLLGADMFTKNNEGKTPLILAMEQAKPCHLEELCTFWLARSNEVQKEAREATLRAVLSELSNPFQHELNHIIENASKNTVAYRLFLDLSSFASLTRIDKLKIVEQYQKEAPHLPSHTYQHIGDYLDLFDKLGHCKLKQLSKEMTKALQTNSQSHLLGILMQSFKPKALSQKEFALFCEVYFSNNIKGATLGEAILNQLDRFYKVLSEEYKLERKGQQATNLSVSQDIPKRFRLQSTVPSVQTDSYLSK